MTAVIMQAGPGGSSWPNIVMMVAIIAIFYFFMIRPQQKRQKDIQKAREALKPNDNVVTAGGIHGRLREIGDTYMVVEIADGVKIKIDKASVFASTGDARQEK
jgi:preprotein translocase subunit YajC